MGANGLKVQIVVSMQLQRALHNPSWGIRVLCSKTISYFLIYTYIHFNHKWKCLQVWRRILQKLYVEWNMFTVCVQYMVCSCAYPWCLNLLNNLLISSATKKKWTCIAELVQKWAFVVNFVWIILVFWKITNRYYTIRNFNFGVN